MTVLLSQQIMALKTHVKRYEQSEYFRNPNLREKKKKKTRDSTWLLYHLTFTNGIKDGKMLNAILSFLSFF